MSSWLHCDVDAAFLRLLLAFLDFAEAAAVSDEPFPTDPFDDPLLLGVELGGLSESRSRCWSFSDVPFVDGCLCLTRSCEVVASFFTYKQIINNNL